MRRSRRSKRRSARWGMALGAAALVLGLRPAGAGADACPGGSVVREVGRIVEEEFFDPTLRGLDWGRLTAEAERDLGETACRPEEVDRVVDGLLERLGASHTRRFGRGHPRRFQLLALFEELLAPRHPELYEGPDALLYEGIGIGWERRGDALVVTEVLHGFPARTAGVRPGDVLLTVDGSPFAGLASFRGRSGEEVSLRLRRKRSDGAAAIVDLRVRPRALDARSVFLEATRKSLSVVERSGVRVGTVRAWSYGGPEQREAIEDLVLRELAGVDALVLDLRGGLGGASPRDLALFDRSLPRLELVDRAGARMRIDRVWRRPAVLLVDETTRSGKEILAAGFRRSRRGPVVGRRTAGALLGGSPFVLSDGSLLYLAVRDLEVDGERLEGLGVEPDVPVAPERGADGDPLLEQAIGVAVGLVVDARRDRRGPAGP